MTRTIIFLFSTLLLPADELKRQALYTAGQDGYAHYRIPGIVVTRKGTILA